jgi:hypothetical protein
LRRRGRAHEGSSLFVSGNQVVNLLESPSAALVLNQTGLFAEVEGNSVF